MAVIDAATRFVVIPVGISRYDEPPPDAGGQQWAELKAVETDLERLRNLFHWQQYRAEGFVMLDPVNGTAGEITDKLTRIVRGIAAQQGLTVLLIWSGHGAAPDGENLRLATSETYEPLGMGSGFSPAELVNKLSDSRAKALCLIFDVCQAGAAAEQVGAAAADYVKKPLAKGKFPGVAALYTTHAFQTADEGLFVEVLERVLRDGPSAEARKRIAEEGIGDISPRNRYLRMSDLEYVLGIEFDVLRGGDTPVHQMPMGHHTGQQFGIFLNPLHKPDAPPVNVEVARRRWLREQDVTEHFLPKARGLEPGEEGWFFSGRGAVSREIVDWIGRGQAPLPGVEGPDPAGGNLYVLTGDGGTGKSSIIGRLVALSDEHYRAEALRSGWNEAADRAVGTLPEVGRIDAALHLRKLTAESAVATLCELLEIKGPEGGELLDNVIANLPAIHPVIVLDALDESSEPARVAEHLIKPLAAKGWRVLVGTRPKRDDVDLLGRLGDAHVRDLDVEPTTRDDIEQYVRQRMANRPHADVIAARVAEKANGSFLYARVTAAGVISRADLDIDNLDEALGNDVGEAFARDLEPLDQQFREEFGRDDEGATALLAALAWAEGEGLPLRDGVWATMATGIWRAPYADEHVRWILREAGRYILESGDGDQAVYRLFHQSLVEHFVSPYRWQIVLAYYGFTKRMPSVVAYDQWDLANPYWVRYLPAHLHRGDRLELLEELCTNPWYLRRALAVLGADGLAELLAKWPSVAAVAKTVRRARVALSQDPAQLVAQLQARLSSERDSSLETMIRALPDVAPPVWLRARAATLDWRAELETTQTFGAKVRALAFGEVNGDPVIAVGAGEQVFFWDPRRGTSNWTISNDGLRVTALGLGKVGGRDVIAVVAGYDGKAVLRDPRSGEVIDAPFPAGGVTKAAVGTVGGRDAVAFGNQGIRVYSFDSNEPFDCDSLSVGRLGGSLCLVERVIGANRFRLINLDTDEETQFAVDEPSQVRGIAIGTHLEHPVVAWSDGHPGRVTYWHGFLDTSTSADMFDFPIRTLAVGEVDGELIVAAGNDSDYDGGYVGIRQPTAEESVRRTLDPELQSVRILGAGYVSDRPVLLAGRLAFDPLTGETFNSARVEQLSGESSVPETVVHEAQQDHRKITLAKARPLEWPVKAEAWEWIGGRLLQARGSWHGAVWIYDPEREEVVHGPFAKVNDESYVWTRSKTSAEAVAGVALGTWGGRGVLAVAYSRKATVYDLESGEPLGSPDAPRSDIVRVALGEINGRPILATGSAGGAVTVWEGPSMTHLAGIRIDSGINGLWLGGAALVVRGTDNRFHVFDVVMH